MVGQSDFGEVDARNLNKSSRQEMRLALQIYSVSFPPVETKSVERVERMLRTDPDYHLYVARSEGAIVGISLVYVFRRLQMGLLDYIAIEPSHRKKGIGTKLFNYSLEEFRKKSANPGGLLIEVQREDLAANRREARMREQRIGFYARLGAKVLVGVRYLLPPQHGSRPEEMHLMIVPTIKLTHLPKSTVLRYIRAIYARVYQYHGGGLVAAVSEVMPGTVFLSEIRSVRAEKGESDG